MTEVLRPGPTNSLTDVPGLRVGQQTRDEPGWLTGVTVVVPDLAAVAGVDVRGGGPGTRETDLLDPRNLVDRVDAIVLGGGSAFGLGACDGVMAGLYADGRGWPMGPTGQVVPIVPGAICFDLGRGGRFDHHPGPADGLAAYRSASSDAVAQGCVGAGTGAKAGGLKGGLGSASAVLPGGAIVAAVVVVNAVGSCADPSTGELYAVRWGLGEEFAEVPRPSAAALATAREAAAGGEPGTMAAGLATTLAVVATDLTMTKAQCQKLAGVGHDGMARAIVPVHSMFDGDTVFAMATGGREAPDPAGFHLALAAAASCVTRAIGHAMVAATSVDRRADGGVQLRCWSDALGV